MCRWGLQTVKNGYLTKTRAECGTQNEAALCCCIAGIANKQSWQTGNSKTNLQTNKHRIREDLANSKEFQAEFETALCTTVKMERDRLLSGLKLCFVLPCISFPCLFF
jgi:hypothetical protein